MRTVEEALKWLDARVPYPSSYADYNRRLLSGLYSQYEVAVKARSKGFDPSSRVESEVAFDLADRVELLLGVPVAERLRELLRQYRTEQAALILAEEVALGKFGFFGTEAAMDFGVRIGLAVVTDGITVAPVQGISSVKIKSNDDGTNYVAIYFAGPIRSAGGTEAAFILIIADRIRKSLGLDRYKPNADEVGRFVEELRIYERDVGNFQFKVSDEDIQHAVLHLPVEIDGVETDPVEVVVHRGLKRIATDKVRGGALRVLNDGVIGRSRKLLKLLEDLAISDWEWLKELKGGKQQVEETGPQASHFGEVISGRPVLSFPKRRGGFRLRYGRCYNTGLSAIGIHPAASALLDYPVVAGTQVKVDMPGKAATVAFVDTIETPLVRLRDGSVIRVKDQEQAEEVRNKVERVLYLGDALISFGDFLENNFPLQPSGYVEELYAQELERSVRKRYGSFERCGKELNISPKLLRSFVKDCLHAYPTVPEAFLLSEKLEVGLHPRYLFYWDLASPSEIILLKQSLALLSDSDSLVTPDEPEIKAVMEKLGIPHSVKDGQLLVKGDEAHSLKRTLNLISPSEPIAGWRSSCELVSGLAGVPIRGKASAFIGIRIGRPEKAIPRRMRPPVHLLFPVGLKGGPTRDLLKAAEEGILKVSLANMVCSRCNIYSPSAKCRNCESETRTIVTCPNCGRALQAGPCPSCKVKGLPYSTVSFPIKQALMEAASKVNHNPTSPLKGVQGLTNVNHIPEPLEKGILRQKHGLSVYKDGTIRFDATNSPLTCFTPKQIGTSVERLRELGYSSDIHGRPLRSDDQLLEMFVQDVVLPVEAAEHLVKASKFLDELLVCLYGGEAYYKVDSARDLIGHLIVGLAPHTSVGVVGHIIGFTNSQVCFAHPYWHSAKRRDCLPHNTELLVHEDGELKTIKLGELVERQFKGLCPSIVDDFGTEEIRDNGEIFAVSMNPSTLRMELRPIVAYIRGKAPGHMVSIKTLSGREVVCTPYHKTLVFREEEVKKVEALEVKEGDLLPVCSKLKSLEMSRLRNISLTGQAAKELAQPILKWLKVEGGRLEQLKSSNVRRRCRTIGDVFLDPVVKVKPLMNGAEVYDYCVEVEGNHNIVVNGGAVIGQCDGDQDSLLLLMDILLNFSRELLPAQIGGLMDAPLLLQPIVIPDEVQRQAHNFDVTPKYPLEFYEATLRGASPADLAKVVETVRERLTDERQFIGLGFTHGTESIEAKRSRSVYSTLKSLPQKLKKQIELAEKIDAVDPNEVVSSVLKTHLLPDIVGNMKAYASQSFRCKSCGSQHRRLPVKGSCLICGGELQSTVTRGSVEKYLRLGQRLCNEFKVEEYLRRRFEATSVELGSLFTPTRTGAQLDLTDFLYEKTV